MQVWPWTFEFRTVWLVNKSAEQPQFCRCHDCTDYYLHTNSICELRTAMRIMSHVSYHQLDERSSLVDRTALS
jgi:hypothetical protein